MSYIVSLVLLLLLLLKTKIQAKMRLVLVMLLALALMASSAHAGRSKVKKEPSSCTQDFAFSSTESADAFLASVLNPISVEDFFTHHFQVIYC